MRGPAVLGEMRVSLRTRLTLIYGALFLLTGSVLIGVTYVLTDRAVKARFRVLVQNEPLLDESGLQAGLEPRTVKSIIRTEVGDQEQKLLGQLLQISLLTMVALAVLAVVLGYVVAGRSLRPLQTVTATARRLSESNLHERIGLSGPRDEIKDLADTFDSMLDRLHQAFDSQRRFIANASHELRTPLAINRAVIEVALAKRESHEETKALARKLLGATTRNERLIEGLLLLARSERQLRNRTFVDLGELVAGVIDQLAEPAKHAGVAVHRRLLPAGTAGDPVLLERCVVNVVENAINYNVTGGHVRVRTDRADGWTLIQVENTGPPVPPEHLETIFEPFRRLNQDRVGSQRGSGLGLSIVRAVCTAHGGVIQTSARPGGGLVLTLWLPAGRPGASTDQRTTRGLPVSGAVPSMSSRPHGRYTGEGHNNRDGTALARPESRRRGLTMQKMTTCLWFDGQAEEAANFYVSLFPDARILDIVRNGAAGPGPEGTVMTISFELNGQEFVGLNGGPAFTFNEAVSFQVHCETQDEVDDFWNRLAEGGEEGQCGWLKDRYGVSWQIIPTALTELTTDADPDRSQRAITAMLGMRKIDIAALQAAADGAVPARTAG